MAYTLTHTNGSIIGTGTIADGTADHQTSLTLVGRNYANYGQVMTNNLVSMLENWANSTGPGNPLAGQLWYNNSTNILQVNINGTTTGWKNLGGATYASSSPTNAAAGDLWFDSTNNQLNAYTGTTWVLIGPMYSSVNGLSGAQREILTDGTNSHVVLSGYLDNRRVYIVALETFTPNVTVPGFAVINAGFNANTSIGNATFWGNANNSSYLGNIASSYYVRTDINNTMYGQLTMLNNNGITIGSSGQLTANVFGNVSAIYSNQLGANLSLYVNSSINGAQRGISISGNTGHAYVNSDPIYNLGIATKQYVDNSFINANLTGIPTAPTAPAGTSNNMIATTQFVTSGLSGIFSNVVYQGNSSFTIVDTGVGYANLTIDGTTVLTATAAGISLPSATQAIQVTATQGNITTQPGNAWVATTSYVSQAAQYWNGSARFVSTNAPTSGDGIDGDFWFQISS